MTYVHRSAIAILLILLSSATIGASDSWIGIGWDRFNFGTEEGDSYAASGLGITAAIAPDSGIGGFTRTTLTHISRTRVNGSDLSVDDDVLPFLFGGVAMVGLGYNFDLGNNLYITGGAGLNGNIAFYGERSDGGLGVGMDIGVGYRLTDFFGLIGYVHGTTNFWHFSISDDDPADSANTVGIGAGITYNF